MRRGPVTGVRAGSSILAHALAAGVACLLVVSAVAWALRGQDSAWSALAGAGVVLVVLVLGLIGISVVVAGETALTMAGAAVVYIGQIILIVAALVVLRDREWLDGLSFAVAAVVQVFVMQVAQVVGYSRGRHVVEANLPSAREPEERT